MRLAILMPSFGDGGVERMLVNLARGLKERGLCIDFLVRKAQGAYLSNLPAEVRLLELGASHPLWVQPPLIRYLNRNRPHWVLAGKNQAARSALLARRLSRAKFHLLMRPGTTASRRLLECGAVTRWRTYRSLRYIYREADAIVANSQGVAEDVAKICPAAATRIYVIRNPVVTPDLQRLAQEPVVHPWFASGEAPVILSVGGLRHAKGFDTLIRAFAQVRQQRLCRLVILGKGHLLNELKQLAVQLGIATDVDLPGFAENPFPYMAKAQAFVLSSRWEGSPNALTEALALGTLVVATDCPSGPREILQNGRFGALVPVDDSEALARSILNTLDNPLPVDFLKQAVTEYTLEECARRYEELLTGWAPKQAQP